MKKLFSINAWLFLMLAFMVYVSPNIISAYLNQSPSLSLSYYNTIWQHVASYAAGALAVIAFVVLIISRSKTKKFYSMDNIDNLRALSWQDFEDLTAQIMRHLHYKVYVGGGAKADGGVDLTAYKKGFKYIVQCKHWKSTSVGVKIVREMLGVSIHEKASAVYIFTCGNFTKEAREFAKDKKIYLINGYQICKFVAQLKAKN